MLTYHCHSIDSGGTTRSNMSSNHLKNKRKNTKKAYKSADKRKKVSCSKVNVVGGGLKKPKITKKKEKKISKKNAQFLKKLGLKVKQER